MAVTRLLKPAALALAHVGALPWLLMYFVKRPLLGADRALQGSSQSLALVPGLLGQYLRRAFLSHVLDEVGEDATVEFGTVFSKAGARIGRGAYVGAYCNLGLVVLGPDVLLASGVHVPSGAHAHGTASLDVPIRLQPGRLTPVQIGEGSWIGTGAIVMADVGRHSIVAAGAVVVDPVPDFVIAAGVPARVVRERTGATAG